MPDPVQTATSFLGTPYKWGGNECGVGVDCSGLVKASYPNLPRTAAAQYLATNRIGAGDLSGGDLIFLQNTNPAWAGNPGVKPGLASHVGIYDGQGGVIVAPHTGGVVRREPLSRWQNNANLLGYGRVGNMPAKTKTRGTAPSTASGPGVTPTGYMQPTGNAAQSMPQVQTDPATGRFDLAPYINAIPQPAMPQMYDPRAPGPPMPNPGYTPPQADLQQALSQAPPDLAQAMGMIGGSDWTQPPAQPTGAPYAPPDLRAYIEQPSDQSQYETAARAQQESAPNPLQMRIDELNAHKGYMDSLTKLTQANPSVQYQLPDRLPMPTRQQDDVPLRQAPRLDPLAGGLAALAGLIDPQHAGQYGTAPLQAGMDVAGQQYQDAQRTFHEHATQLSQQYEDQLAQRNDLAHYQTAKSGANFQNADALRQDALKAGQTSAQGESDQSLAGALGLTGAAEKASQGQGLEAALAQGRMQQGFAGNANAIALFKDNTKQSNDLYKTILMAQGRSNSSDNTLQGRLDANEARRAGDAQHYQTLLQMQGMRSDMLQQQLNSLEIRNAANNQTKGDIAKGHDTQSGLNAQTRAQAITSRAQNAYNINGLPMEQKIQMQAYSNAYSTAYRVAAQAGIDPETAPNVVHALDTLNNAAQRAEQYRAAQRPQAPATPGQPGAAPAPARPGAATRPASPGGVLPFIKNLKIGK